MWAGVASLAGFRFLNHINIKLYLVSTWAYCRCGIEIQISVLKLPFLNEFLWRGFHIYAYLIASGWCAFLHLPMHLYPMCPSVSKFRKCGLKKESLGGYGNVKIFLGFSTRLQCNTLICLYAPACIKENDSIKLLAFAYCKDIPLFCRIASIASSCPVFGIRPCPIPRSSCFKIRVQLRLLIISFIKISN